MIALLRAELAAGILGLKIFIACALIASFVTSAVWMIGDGLTGALKRGGTVFLGGDVAVTVVNVPLAEDLRERLGDLGKLSTVTELRTSARLGGKRAVVEAKGVDTAYPLYGSVILESGRTLAAALTPVDGRPAAVAEPALLGQTGARVGDTVSVGDQDLVITDVLVLEPDRLSAGRFMVGPRLLMGMDSLRDSGLIRQGSLVEYRYRLAFDGAAAPSLAAVRALRPDAGWELETPDDAGDRVIRTVERTTTFLGMAGIVALAIGLAGMWASAKAWVTRRGRTIALYRLSGAQPSTTLALHAAIIAIASLIGLVLGLGLAALLSWQVVALVSTQLHLAWSAPDLIDPLLEVVGILIIGVSGTGLFALSTAIQVPPGAAMRSGEAEARMQRGQAAAGLALVTAAMAVATVTLPIPRIAAMTGIGLGAAALVLIAASAALAVLSQRRPATGFMGSIIQQGLAKTGPVAARAVAIGIGIAGITAIVGAQNSLETALRTELPERIPDLVLIDVQPDQIEAIRARVAGDAGLGGLQANPFMRMTVTRINGVPAKRALVRADKRWVIEGDRSFSWTAEPTGAELLAGAWWPADYDGPPLVSPEEDMQEAFDLKPGDTVTYSFLGRTFTSEVANIRKEYHRTFRPEYLMMASPNPFRHAPQTWIVSLQGRTPADVDAFVRDVAATHPNVTSIDIRLIVAQVVKVVEGAAAASVLIALILIVAGALSLAAVVAAEVDARRRDSLVFTMLGASRREVALARLGEALAIGLIAAAVGGAAGWLGGYGLVSEGLHVAWTPGFGVYVLPLALGLIAAAAAGLAGGLGALPRGRGQIVRLLTS